MTDMKLIIASVLALTATTAAADHRRHCGTTQSQHWENNYVRVIETRDCRGRLIDWRRIDSTPSNYRPHRHKHVEHHTNTDVDAVVLGVILGTILSTANK